MANSASQRMLIVPYKKSFDLDLSYNIKSFLDNTYAGNPNLQEFKQSVDSLNLLRNEALFRAARQEKLNKLMRYHDQLQAIETKIPIAENQIRIPFKWQDAFDKGNLFVGKSSFTLSSGFYERLCVLFNIGASCSEVASLQSFETEDGLKQAAKNYQLAAGAFSFIKDNALTATRQDCTFDLYPETLNLLSALMLAQAQEVFYIKAVKDKMKDLTISKIAVQCSDYYSEAMKSIQIDYLKDIQKQWLQAIAGKQAYFHALAEYHRSLYEENEKRIGEQIARLTKSLELIKVSVDRSGKDAAPKNQLSIIQQAYDKAKKDNDYVYHEKVPDYKALPAIERAAIAKPTPIKFPLSEDFRDLFSNLVPITVHNGILTFNSKRMEAVNLEIGKLRQATDLLNGALATWNLPAAIEDVNGGSAVPQSVIEKSRLIKDKGGISSIDRLMSELPNLLQRNSEILTETKHMLEDEERSDNELRLQMKEKWTRTSSKDLNSPLFNEIKQYEQIMDNAISANKIIEGKYEKHRDSIVLLSKSEHEISNSLPAANAVAALQNTHIVRDLRRLMQEVEGLRNVREVLESELKSLDTDSVKAKLVSSLQLGGGIDEHAIIQEQLEDLICPLRKQVRENIQEQEKLLGYIEKANSEFCKERVLNESSKLREEMLKNLAQAYDGFTELYSNLEEGNKFYNDLTPILVKFQTKVSDFVFARKTEKEDLMKDIQSAIARGTPTAPQRPPSSQTTPQRPPPPPTIPNSSSTQAPPYPNTLPYPTMSSPYIPQIPNTYLPFSFYQQPGAPQQQPSYPQQPNYPPAYPQQPPIVPPRSKK